MRKTMLSFVRAHLRQKWALYVFLIAVYVMGVVFGSFGATTLPSAQSGELKQYVDVFVTHVHEKGADNIFLLKEALFKNLAALIVLYVLGLTAVGIPVIGVVLFTRGFTLGFTVGFLVQEKAWQGFWLTLLTVLPQNILFIPVLIIAAAAAVSFSLWLLRGRLRPRTIEIPSKILAYTVNMAILLVFAGVASVLEAYLCPAILKIAAGYVM